MENTTENVEKKRKDTGADRQEDNADPKRVKSTPVTAEDLLSFVDEGFAKLTPELKDRVSASAKATIKEYLQYIGNRGIIARDDGKSPEDVCDAMLGKKDSGNLFPEFHRNPPSPDVQPDDVIRTVLQEMVMVVCSCSDGECEIHPVLAALQNEAEWNPAATAGATHQLPPIFAWQVKSILASDSETRKFLASMYPNVPLPENDDEDAEFISVAVIEKLPQSEIDMFLSFRRNEQEFRSYMTNFFKEERLIPLLQAVIQNRETDLLISVLSPPMNKLAVANTEYEEMLGEADQSAILRFFLRHCQEALVNETLESDVVEQLNTKWNEALSKMLSVVVEERLPNASDEEVEEYRSIGAAIANSKVWSNEKNNFGIPDLVKQILVGNQESAEMALARAFNREIGNEVCALVRTCGVTLPCKELQDDDSDPFFEEYGEHDDKCKLQHCALHGVHSCVRDTTYMTDKTMTQTKQFLELAKEANLPLNVRSPTSCDMDNCECPDFTETLLVAACGSSSPALFKLLLDVGVDVNGSVEGDGFLPVLAVLAKENYKYNQEVVELLITRGADVNEEGTIDDGNDPCPASALTIAAENCNLEFAKVLIKHGANPNGNSHAPPLLFAIQTGIHTRGVTTTAFSEELVRLLLDNGASVAAVKSSPYYDEERLFDGAAALLEEYAIPDKSAAKLQ